MKQRPVRKPRAVANLGHGTGCRRGGTAAAPGLPRRDERRRPQPRHPRGAVRHAGQGARGRAREDQERADRNLVVEIRGGTYPVTETLAFGPEDSGTDRFSITWAAAPGEKGCSTAGGGSAAGRRARTRSGPRYSRRRRPARGIPASSSSTVGGPSGPARPTRAGAKGNRSSLSIRSRRPAHRHSHNHGRRQRRLRLAPRGRVRPGEDRGRPGRVG